MVKLGLVTYNLAKSWDLDTIVERCSSHGIAAVELRTTHAHGVEISMGTEERKAVRESSGSPRFSNLVWVAHVNIIQGTRKM